MTRLPAAMAPIDYVRLDNRARWLAILGPGHVTPLTADEQRALDAWRLHRWIPQGALQYAWAHVDPIHGCAECAWSWPAFVAELEADRVEINAVTSEHPDQTDRLRQWLLDVEALGRQRDTDSRPVVGEYYERLSTLGYDANAQDKTDND